MIGKFFIVIAVDLAIAIIVMKLRTKNKFLRGLLWLIGVDEIDVSQEEPKRASDIQLMLALVTTMFTAAVWHYGSLPAGILAGFTVNVLWRALKETFPKLGL